MEIVSTTSSHNAIRTNQRGVSNTKKLIESNWTKLVIDTGCVCNKAERCRWTDNHSVVNKTTLPTVRLVLDNGDIYG